MSKHEPGPTAGEVKDAFVVALEERMRAVAREVFAEQVRLAQSAAVSPVDGQEVHEFREALERIRAKEFPDSGRRCCISRANCALGAAPFFHGDD